MASVPSITTENPLTRTNAMANASAASGSQSAKPSTISSNDFLTLLVTEMKNQDPTAQTDPNQYVNQLVQVNSLEQLIEINQNLSTSTVTKPVAHGVAAAIPAQTSAALSTSTVNSVGQAASHRTSIPVTSGNLSVPQEIRRRAASRRH